MNRGLKSLQMYVWNYTAIVLNPSILKTVKLKIINQYRCVNSYIIQVKARSAKRGVSKEEAVKNKS